jgi:hypothetical protein
MFLKRFQIDGLFFPGEPGQTRRLKNKLLDLSQWIDQAFDLRL